ncbi:MAG: AsmA family protein [Gammaproteobacteria bacterium]|nr:AsmA family protein [Gammaproteobacteria bacterium]
MRKFLKIASITIGLILLSILVVVGLLITFVSPDRLKPVIVKQVYNYTGHELVIDGNLSWSIFPYLSIQVGHMTLNNSSDFKEKIFAEVTRATVGIKLLPLLHRRIEANGISITGATINLIKDSSGKANWDFKSSAVSEAANVDTSKEISIEKNITDPAATPENNKKMIVSLTIPNVDVTGVHITWKDEAKKQYADIDKFELHAKNINLDQSFPLTSNCNFTINSPNLSGEAKLDGNIKIDLSNQVYQMSDIYFVVKSTQEKKKITLALSGDVVADVVKDTFVVSHLVGHAANLNVEGKVNITKMKTAPQITGHLEAQPFDLKEFMQKMGVDSANIEVAKNVAFDMDFSLDGQQALLKGMKSHGNVKIEELVAANLKLQKLSLETNFKDALLDISPMSASLYNGTLQAASKINFVSTEPQITSHITLTNIDAQPLLKDLQEHDSKINVKGSGNVDLQITTAGVTSDAMLRNLNGNSQISFKNGVLEGMNVGYMADSAFALARHETLPAQGGDSTEFGNLTATAVIHNGVLNNDDLLLDSPRFITKGKGTIDLVNQKIDYKLQTTSKEAALDKRKNILNVYNLTIPIQIVGSLKSPSIRVDSEDLLKQVAQQQIQKVEDQAKDKVNEQLKNVIKDKIPGKAGEMLQNILGN